LNQISLNDREYGATRDEEKLMTEIDRIIETKIQEVNYLNETCLGMIPIEKNRAKSGSATDTCRYDCLWEFLCFLHW